VDFICKYCGKHLKTEKGLAGHEKRHSEKEMDEGPVAIAKEAGKQLEIDVQKLAEAEDARIKEEMEKELERLKEQYNQQKEEEERLNQERSELARERDELYKDMTTEKPKAAAAVLDPFGEGLDEGEELPAISGPIGGFEPEEPARAEVKPDVPEPAPPPTRKPRKVNKVDLTARTAELKRKLAGGAEEPPAAPGEAEVAAEEPPVVDLTAPETGLPSPGLAPEDLDGLKSQIGADLRRSISRLDTTIAELNERIIDKPILESMMKNRVTRDDFADVMDELRKDLGKIENRISELAEEVGFGESLNVSKIPPTILESVYDATLADAVKALVQNMGPYDAEALILKILEDIRTQTSGSELFKYEGGRLKIINLSKSLETKLISAKQIQATYSEILKRIKEHTPGYKPKNFRAMLKIKSQEFAVDKTSGLTEVLSNIHSELEEFKKVREEIDARLSELEEVRYSISNDLRELEQRLDALQVAPVATAVSSEDEPAETEEDEG
jgi:predicted  nucleic acid-binding Zn-ribbon protein